MRTPLKETSSGLTGARQRTQMRVRTGSSCPHARALHSSSFQLNVSTFCGIGGIYGVRRRYVGGDSGRV